ncbi:MAG: hypothetical protein HY826_09130 [Actinobacteria bacterium]|nr:hypothetical protein [Actinomycetota bacterium]
MAKASSDTSKSRNTRKARDTKKDAPVGQIPQTVQLLKDYARQETLGPLKGAGRWIALGIAGALLIGVATAFLALGALRMIQTEWPSTFRGRWMSLVPYASSFVFCLIVAGLAMMRINKQPLNKEKS